MIKLYRLSKSEYADELTGEGARKSEEDGIQRVLK